MSLFEPIYYRHLLAFSTPRHADFVERMVRDGYLGITIIEWSRRDNEVCFFTHTKLSQLEQQSFRAWQPVVFTVNRKAEKTALRRFIHLDLTLARQALEVWRHSLCEEEIYYQIEAIHCFDESSESSFVSNGQLLQLTVSSSEMPDIKDIPLGFLTDVSPRDSLRHRWNLFLTSRTMEQFGQRTTEFHLWLKDAGIELSSSEA